MSAVDAGKLRKRSMVIAGHSTSISLEDAFWDALREMAAAKGLSVAGLVAQVDSARGSANLCSALRVTILSHYRNCGVRGGSSREEDVLAAPP
jgi:predicted DNA-binding ribbon-helix-helix protein